MLRMLEFEKSNVNCIGKKTLTKRYDNKKHSSAKLTPTQVSFKQNEGNVHQNFLCKKVSGTEKKLGDSVRIANKNYFLKSDTTYWS